MSDVRIEARVVIREVLDERTGRAELPNGKIIFIFSKMRDPLPDLRVGEERAVLLSLCDFSEGRVMPRDYASPPPPLPAGESAAS